MRPKRTIPQDMLDCGVLEDRFRDYLDVPGSALCWPFIGARDAFGYGRFVIERGNLHYAHRVAWALHTGANVPDGLRVLHTCDNPPCCNPAHLYLGTIARNNQDRYDRGRVPSIAGSKNPMARLAEQDILDIRARWRQGEREATIAPDYPVARKVIYKVATYRSWRHLP